MGLHNYYSGTHTGFHAPEDSIVLEVGATQAGRAHGHHNLEGELGVAHIPVLNARRLRPQRLRVLIQHVRVRLADKTDTRLDAPHRHDDAACLQRLAVRVELGADDCATSHRAAMSDEQATGGNEGGKLAI